MKDLHVEAPPLVSPIPNATNNTTQLFIQHTARQTASTTLNVFAPSLSPLAAPSPPLITRSMDPPE